MTYKTLRALFPLTISKDNKNNVGLNRVSMDVVTLRNKHSEELEPSQIPSQTVGHYEHILSKPES